MSNILYLDTTQQQLMMALATPSGFHAVPLEKSGSYRQHSAILLPTLQEMLQTHGLKTTDLSAIALNTGPGSFTGIRTGLTVARLMGQFMPLTLYAFNTFELLAGATSHRNQTVHLYLDAFRNQHYQASLSVKADGSISWLSEAAVYPNESPPDPQGEICLVDRSLEKKPFTFPESFQWLDEQPVFTPEVMAFYLQHDAERFQVNWENLQPLYMQLPQITQPKPRQALSDAFKTQTNR